MIILYYIVPGLLFCYLLPLNFGAICFWRGGSLLENVEDECTVRINKAKGATIMEASRHSDESIVVAVRPHPLFSRDESLPKIFGPLPSRWSTTLARLHDIVTLPQPSPLEKR